MLLKYFYDETLAQASYMVGCAANGDALVIDAGRDIQQYIDVANKEGLKIRYVTETHIHADYVSGSHELAYATGAQLFLSDCGTPEWKYGKTSLPTVLLNDGDSWMVGNIRIEVIHTPGHTPEHIVFMITDTAAADEPIGVFTGDFIFVGDVGRPDLLEEAAGVVGTKEPGARLQYLNIVKFKDMPDYLQIWPGHGSGSACGKALGAIPSTTLGYEKRFNPAFQFSNQNDFVAWLLDGQPEPPKYFAQMKKVNRQVPALLKDTPRPVQLDAVAFEKLVAEGAQILDTRPLEQFTGSYLQGTFASPASNKSFSTWAGWYVDFERPLYLVAYPDQLDRILVQLRSIGVDNTPAFFDPQEVVTERALPIPSMSVTELAERMPKNGMVVLDVRGASERADGYIANTQHIPMGFVPRHFDELPKDHPIVVHCQSGTRSSIVATVLLNHGYQNVTNVSGGFSAWEKATLPIER